MKSRTLASDQTATAESDELFEMANLYPRTTGLPMTVWVSPRGNARHDVRIKVNMIHGNQMTIDNTAIVAVRSSPHVVAGWLSTEDERAVSDWIALNATTIVAYWEGAIDTVQLAQMLKPLPATS
jgi:hypothetical protein